MLVEITKAALVADVTVELTPPLNADPDTPVELLPVMVFPPEVFVEPAAIRQFVLTDSDCP